MRETPLSTCEREFILRNISEHRRLDGRKAYDYRSVRITFGVTLGCCHVDLGKTRVLAQVSCQVGQPKPSRPHDGVLFINVELSPMASPVFETGRMTEEGIELSRLMERCLKESRCVDLESLCIVSGEKAWHVRVDIHILNHEGNLLDCSSIAAIAALAHFRRPDVSVKGEEIIIHTMEEKDPVPLSIHHMPLLVSFAFFTQGKYMLIDPSEKEEKVMDGKMVIGMNKHREICTLQVTGQMLLLQEQVLRCSSIAVTKVGHVTELILEALKNDKEARKRGEKHGFAEMIQPSAASNAQPGSEIKLAEGQDNQVLVSSDNSDDEMDEGDEGQDDSAMEENGAKSSQVEILTSGVGMLGEGAKSSWIDFPKGVKDKSGKLSKTVSAKDHIMLQDDDDSEEETQVVLM